MAHCLYTASFCLINEHLDKDGLCYAHCKHGLAMMESFRSMALENKLTPERIARGYKLMDDHLVECHGYSPQSKTHSGNGLYQGAFAFTLTKSPDDDLTEEDMIKAAEKIMNQQSCPVEKYAWYLEYGDPELKAHPHIHGMYETTTKGRIERKHFKRAWPIWDEKTPLGRGFRGGYHRPVRAEEGYSDYIKKQGGISRQKNISPPEV